MRTNNKRQDEVEDLHMSLRSAGLSRSLTRADVQILSDIQCFVTKNALNMISLLASVIVAFTIGWMGWGRDVKGSFNELHHESFITPVFWTYSLWIIIYLLEIIFVVIQVIEPYKDLPVIQDGIGWYFFLVHCSQIAWVVSYVFDALIVATIFMLLCVIFLFLLCINIYFFDFATAEGASIQPDTHNAQKAVLSPVIEFVTLRLPFHLHFGWAVFTLFVNINQIAGDSDLSWQPSMAIASLIFLWIIGMIYLFYPRHPIFTIPLAIAWGAMGIWCKLTPIPDSLVQNFTVSEVKRIRGGAIAICLELLILSILRFIFHIASHYHVEPVKTEEESDRRSSWNA